MTPRIDTALCGRILRLAGPMIFSMMGMTIMNFVDGMFLSRYSDEAVAAVGSAGLMAWLLTSLFLGAVGFTSTLVAHYHGAGRDHQTGVATWQGIRLAVLSSGIMGLLSMCAVPLFRWVHHAPGVQVYEVTYYSIICLGSQGALIAGAISGFFLGRGETRVVFLCHTVGQLTHVALDYVLIFGRWGFPAWGVAGGAVASIIAQGIVALLLLCLFLRKRYCADCATWSGRGYNRDMTVRLLRFGLPNGFRFVMELMAWTAFLFYVGRIGTAELAASTIAWRINGLVFFPVVGLSEAIRTLVGQSQARRDVRESLRITWHGLMLAEVWMIAGAVLFLMYGTPLYHLFQGHGSPATITKLGSVLLRFVAAYCLMDAFNIVVVGALVAAGDTRVTFWISLLMNGAFITAMAVADHVHAGLMVEWSMATAFVMVTAVAWILRLRSDAWHRIEVIEPALE